MTLDDAARKAQAQAEYAAGQYAFERGNYREAIGYFERGIALANGTTPLGGELQIWLVNAFSATERQEDAIALCEKLTHHPDLDVRKQSKRLLFILKAPRLKLKPEWKTQIPDLSALDSDRNEGATLSRYAATAPRRPPRPQAPPEPEDLSQLNTRDNGFLWVALLGILLLLGSVIWWR